MLSKALSEASNAGGHWLNASGKKFPRLYPQGVSASPFNALFMALHSDRYGCKTNLFTLYSDAKARGTAVREHEQGVPFLFYNWNKYVNRNNPEETIDRTAYIQLSEEQKAQFKGIHNREIRTLFNIDQTTQPYVDKEGYEEAVAQDGTAQERGYTEADNRRLRSRFNDFCRKCGTISFPCVRTEAVSLITRRIRMRSICRVKRISRITTTMCRKRCGRS